MKVFSFSIRSCCCSGRMRLFSEYIPHYPSRYALLTAFFQNRRRRIRFRYSWQALDSMDIRPYTDRLVGLVDVGPLDMTCPIEMGRLGIRIVSSLGFFQSETAISLETMKYSPLFQTFFRLSRKLWQVTFFHVTFSQKYVFFIRQHF